MEDRSRSELWTGLGFSRTVNAAVVGKDTTVATTKPIAAVNPTAIAVAVGNAATTAALGKDTANTAEAAITTAECMLLIRRLKTSRCQ